MIRLDGKVAIVLGAAGAGNMGQVIARAFAAAGARVMVAGRKAAPLQVNGGLTLRPNPTPDEMQAAVMAAMQQP